MTTSAKVSQGAIPQLGEGSTPSPTRARIDPDTERAARAFMQRISGTYPDARGIVFGSRVRGTHTAESDADLAVILRGDRGDRYVTARNMAGVAFDVMLETGVLVDPLPLWEGEIERPDTFSNPALIENILREGVRL